MKAERHRLYFPRIFDPRGRRIVEISVLVENVPGMIAKIARAVAERGINILWGVHHEADEPSFGWWCFFIDATDVDVEPLLESIRQVEGVKRVYSSETVFGKLALDIHHAEQVFGEDRVIELRQRWLVGALNNIYEKWGEDGRFLMYQLGYYGGYESCREWRERSDLEGRELAELDLRVIEVLGWVRQAELVEFDPDAGVAVVRTWGSFESVIERGRPSCHFMRGELAGFFSAMFGRGLYGTEVKCEAKGDQYCEFVIAPKPFEIGKGSSREEGRG